MSVASIKLSHSKCVFLAITILSSTLLACQSSPPTTLSQQSKAKTGFTTIEVTRRSAPVIKSKDGVQDIPWTITQVKYKKALFFNQMPSLTLQSASQRITGSTGCNSIYGQYNINVSAKTLTLDGNAGHQTCNNALAQEADLMDALKRVSSFELQGKSTIKFYDANRQLLIQAEQR